MCAFYLYLVLLRVGEPGLEEGSSLLVVSMREALLWSCLPADDSGLFTAPKTLADFGLKEKTQTGVRLDMRPVLTLAELCLILPFLV